MGSCSSDLHSRNYLVNGKKNSQENKEINTVNSIEMISKELSKSEGVSVNIIKSPIDNSFLKLKGKTIKVFSVSDILISIYKKHTFILRVFIIRNGKKDRVFAKYFPQTNSIDINSLSWDKVGKFYTAVIFGTIGEPSFFIDITRDFISSI